MPNMPSPRRTARRSIKIIMRLGMDHDTAACLVSDIAMDCYTTLSGQGDGDYAWFLHVAGEALASCRAGKGKHERTPGG